MRLSGTLAKKSIAILKYCNLIDQFEGHYEK